MALHKVLAEKMLSSSAKILHESSIDIIRMGACKEVRAARGKYRINSSDPLLKKLEMYGNDGGFYRKLKIEIDIIRKEKVK
jgi:hypothetical protein